ncbi:MAG: cysteine hydrolase [Clostridia bacterium]|nr:cysteine hydrolase [Clostridia bacterium]
MNKALIVIDAQEDFTRGSLRNEEAIKALPVIHEVVEFAENNEFSFIAYTMDTHGDDYYETQEGKNLPVTHCIRETPGWQLCPEVLGKDKSPKIVYKETFGTLDWERLFQGRKPSEILLCGFCTDICVIANFQILKATFPEVPITVISDASAGVTPELHDAALKVMKSCQARIASWDELKGEA